MSRVSPFLHSEKPTDGPFSSPLAWQHDECVQRPGRVRPGRLVPLQVAQVDGAARLQRVHGLERLQGRVRQPAGAQDQAEVRAGAQVVEEAAGGGAGGPGTGEGSSR